MGSLGNRLAAGALAAVLATSGVPTAALAKAVYEGRGWPCAHAEPVDETASTEAGVEPVDEEASGEAGVEPVPPASPLCLAVADADEPGKQSVYSVSYLDENGERASHECEDAAELPDVQGVTLSDGWYAVRSDKSFSDHCLSVTGDVNLVLCDGAALTCSQGIRNRGTLTVWAQSDATAKGGEKPTGKLVATGGKRHAGIGGGDEGKSGGAVTINGGRIEAHGGTDAAGIGGAYKGDGGEITISGGDVRAYGDDNGAGIGGGEYGRGGKITVSGGRVHAEAERGGFFTAGAAGIGGGEDRDGGEITISGGEVTAIGGKGSRGSGAGIGGGDEGSGGKVTITGGTVTATGGINGGAGIGGGQYCPGGKVEISGGAVTATGGSKGGAGIGGGVDGDGGTVEIHGGEVIATSKRTGGTLFSWDVAWGAGIGGGDDGDTGKVTVDGGRVEAHGYQAIGHGEAAEARHRLRSSAVSVDTSKVKIFAGACDGPDVLMLECADGGVCGDCLWAFMPDGELRIMAHGKGKSKLGDPSTIKANRWPWQAHLQELRSLTFDDNVELPADCEGMFGDLKSVSRVAVSKGLDVTRVFPSSPGFKWHSQADGKYYESSEIRLSRKGVADTYTRSIGDPYTSSVVKASE